MAKVISLLTSEDFVKSISPISDNLSGKYLLSAIREAQEIHLKCVIGSALLERCKELVRSGEIDNAKYGDYAELVERCRYYLAYMAIAECVPKVSFKVANAGVVRTTDEHLQAPSYAEVALVEKQYRNKADFYCYELQKWLCANRSQFPELTECECERIGANLRSSASCGIFLGGARGK